MFLKVYICKINIWSCTFVEVDSILERPDATAPLWFDRVDVGHVDIGGFQTGLQINKTAYGFIWEEMKLPIEDIVFLRTTRFSF